MDKKFPNYDQSLTKRNFERRENQCWEARIWQPLDDMTYKYFHEAEMSIQHSASP